MQKWSSSHIRVLTVCTCLYPHRKRERLFNTHQPYQTILPTRGSLFKLLFWQTSTSGGREAKNQIKLISEFRVSALVSWAAAILKSPPLPRQASSRINKSILLHFLTSLPQNTTCLKSVLSATKASRWNQRNPWVLSHHLKGWPGRKGKEHHA